MIAKIELKAEERQELLRILESIPELLTEGGRRTALELAGLGKFVPLINLSGIPKVVLNEIVTRLIAYGRLSYEHQALGLLLNTLKDSVGVEQQAVLDGLMMRHQMMTPIAPVGVIPAQEWRGHDTDVTVLEKIVGENTLRPIAFLAQGLKTARSVAYVGVHTGSGTGFLVERNLLLTNRHVLPTVERARDAVFRFNYEENWRGEAQATREFRAALDGVFVVSGDDGRDASLDYCLVELAGDPGDEHGWLPLRSKDVKRDDRVSIIQHPGGQPKQISFQNNFVAYVGGHVVQYVTSTKNGSSGSPVLDDRWEVVALHHAGGNIREPTTQRRYYRNEGILVSRILKDLPEGVRNRVEAAGA